VQSFASYNGYYFANALLLMPAQTSLKEDAYTAYGGF
jgi:hypothetical protein